jgi:hypothetical protein
MAHFAKLDENNNVIQVDAVNNSVINDLPFPESEPIGVEFLKSIYGENTRWIQTSYNSNFRGIYAALNGTYDSIKDVFVPVKPMPSWILDESGYKWVEPVPYPNDGKNYDWDESIVNWVEITYNENTPTQV